MVTYKHFITSGNNIMIQNLEKKIEIIKCEKVESPILWLNGGIQQTKPNHFNQCCKDNLKHKKMLKPISIIL